MGPVGPVVSIEESGPVGPVLIYTLKGKSPESLMDINKAFISLFGIAILYGTYTYYATPVSTIQQMNGATPWGEQVGRSKQIQSKTGDASMFIQQTRRTATQNGGVGANYMEATIDYHFITRICPFTCLCCDKVEGGGADLNTGLTYGGGGAEVQGACAIDGGNA